MDDKQKPALQLIAPVFRDDPNVDPAPEFAVITCTQAQAHRILTALQTAAALKTADPYNFFSFTTQAGCATFVESDFDLEELCGHGGGEAVRVPLADLFDGSRIEEMTGELRVQGHLAEYSDDGVRFVGFAKHSGDRFETCWIPAAEFEEAAGGPLTDRVVLLSVSYESLNKGAFVADDLYDEGDSEADIIRGIVGSKFEDLRDSGYITGPAVSNF